MWHLFLTPRLGKQTLHCRPQLSMLQVMLLSCVIYFGHQASEPPS